MQEQWFAGELRVTPKLPFPAPAGETAQHWDILQGIHLSGAESKVVVTEPWWAPTISLRHSLPHLALSTFFWVAQQCHVTDDEVCQGANFKNSAALGLPVGLCADAA